jgi:hypothetical protein
MVATSSASSSSFHDGSELDADAMEDSNPAKLDAAPAVDDCLVSTLRMRPSLARAKVRHEENSAPPHQHGSQSEPS